MKSIIVLAMLAGGFASHGEIYTVEVQFSTNTIDVTSLKLHANGQAKVEVGEKLEVEGKEILLGTQLAVTKLVSKDNDEVYIEFSATKRSVIGWEDLPDGGKKPFFKIQSLNDQKVSVVCGKWIAMGGIVGKEQMRLRITKEQ